MPTKEQTQQTCHASCTCEFEGIQPDQRGSKTPRVCRRSLKPTRPPVARSATVVEWKPCKPSRRTSISLCTAKGPCRVSRRPSRRTKWPRWVGAQAEERERERRADGEPTSPLPTEESKGTMVFVAAPGTKYMWISRSGSPVTCIPKVGETTTVCVGLRTTDAVHHFSPTCGEAKASSKLGGPLRGRAK